MPFPNLYAGVKRWLGYDIDRPECVSGTDPTVAEQDCQTEEKERDQPEHQGDSCSQTPKRRRVNDGGKAGQECDVISGAESQTVKKEHDDSFSTAPTSLTADLASNVEGFKDVGELTGKSVKELREICKAKGIDAPTCSDKGDLVDLITSKEDEESRESGVGALGSSLSVESQQTSSVVTESDVLEKNLAMEDEQDHFREQAGASGKRDRILRILRYIEDGAGNNTHSQHKRHVIVLGLTGSGKSTTINSLAGCKLRRVTEEEADRFELSRDALVVASGGERGGRKEATKIGNRFGKSQTEVLQAVAVDENDDDASGMILWDAPGFEDSSGPEQNIANAVNLQRLLKDSSHTGSGLAVLVVLDAPSLEGGRGGLVKKTLDMLSQLFGGRALLESKLASLVFCITKAQVDRYALSTLRNWIVKLAVMEGISLEECRDRMVLYDPLRQDDQDKKALTALLRTVTPVGDNAFQTSLNDQDKMLLCELADECSSATSACMAASNAQGALDHWKSFEKLNVIQHPAFEQGKERVRKCVLDLVKEWRARVRMLFTDHTAQGREEVKRFLELLKAGCIFCRAATKEEDELGGMDKEYRELVQEVKEEEAKYQGKQHTELEFKFSKLQAEFRDALTTRADREIKTASSNGGEGGGVSLSRRQTTCLWSYAESIKHPATIEKLEFVSHCEKGRDILGWFGNVANIAQERWDQCINGDQCDLAALVEQKRKEVLQVCQGVVRESKLMYDIHECVRDLLQHSDAAVEAKGSELCAAGRLFAGDVAKLPSLGFAKDGEQKVKLLRKLLDQARGLQAVAVIAATRQVDQVVNAFLAEVYDRAIRKKEEWTKDYRKLTRKIDKILIEEQYERDVQQLRAALDALKKHVDQGRSEKRIYTEKLSDIKTNIEKLQQQGDLITLVAAGNYNEIAKRYRTMTTLKKELTAHDLQVDETPLREFATRTLDSLYAAAESEINKDPAQPGYLELTSLRKLTAIWPTLYTAFPDTVDKGKNSIKNLATSKVNQIVVRVEQEVIAIGREMMTKDAEEFIANMLIKGQAIATEMDCPDHFKKGIQEALEKGIDDQGRYIIGTSLEIMTHRKGDAAIYAQAIIDTFPAFKNFNRKLFNAKAMGVGFDRALTLLRCEPASAHVNVLDCCYRSYDAVYSAEVNEIVKSLQEYQIERTKGRITELATELQPLMQQPEISLMQQPEKFGQLLGFVCAAWTYLSCTTGGMYNGGEKSSVLQPHATQILGILRLFALDQSGGICNHLIQINTGEGKSVALGLTAVILATLGFSVDVVCYSSYLCERDEEAFKALFELLDQRPYISYNDFNKLSTKIMQKSIHLPEIRSTFRHFLESESKKRARAAAGDGEGEDLYALLGLSTTASRDDIKNAYRQKCKEYHPDKNNGDTSKTELFKKIQNAYDVWVSSDRGGARRDGDGAEEGASSSKRARGRGLLKREHAAVVKEESFIEIQKGGSGGADKTTEKYDGAVVVKEEREMKNRRSVLLVDEVDVFFGEGFYGKPYRPCIDLDDGYDDGFNLLHFLWQHRDTFPPTQKSVQKLMASKAVAGLLKAFPNLFESMLERELLKMLEAAMRFPMSCAPKLTGNENNYSEEILVQEKRICYIDPASGVPAGSIKHGYVTAFTYLHLLDQGSLTMQDVKPHVKLQPCCGTLSYSKIPTYYNYCLGMTGTLECLTKEQNELLSQYGFRQRTFLPSTFAKKTLNALQDVQHVSTLVVTGSYDEYFNAILDDITRELIKGRAILIVFPDSEKLKKFSANIHKRSPNVPQAIRKFRITLMTRPYGRGTDFVCRDQGLVKNGGVHIIVTFEPEDESEYKQLMGRTCRQDDPGSGRKILFEEDLKYLDVSENKFMASGIGNWDTFLKQCKDKHLTDKYISMKTKQQEIDKRHELTLEACTQVDQRNWKKAAECFFDASSDLVVTARGSKNNIIEICFVMDCTGSMAESIQACQDKVIAIAENIQQHVNQQDRIRMAFVAYRDYKDKSASSYDSPGKPEVCGFTENIEMLKAFVRRQKAEGGDDVPEDICGGLREASALSWEGSSRHLFLIADAPCHGCKYHTQQDTFPDGDPTGLEPEKQLEQLMHTQKVTCKFLKLDNITDKMMTVINDYCKKRIGREVCVISLNDGGNDLAQELENAVTSSVVHDLMMHFY